MMVLNWLTEKHVFRRRQLVRESLRTTNGRIKEGNMENSREPQSAKHAESVNSAKEFNFEQWASQVRPQLLASLQKRGIK